MQTERATLIAKNSELEKKVTFLENQNDSRQATIDRLSNDVKMLEEELGKAGKNTSKLLVASNHKAKADYFESTRKELTDVKRLNTKLENEVK